MTKGAATRERIFDTAMELFRSQGYAETTMRQIAQQAGVAVGNAYYYFRGKDDLILEFYAHNHEDHLRLLGDKLDGLSDFGERLKLVLRTKIDSAMPYQRLATKLFTTAADPDSPLSPFGPQSAPTRQAAVDLLTEVIEGADLRVPKALQDDLPELLWLYEMGVILYWVHDRSDGAERTYQLIERTVPVVEKLVSLAKLPVVRPLVRELVTLLHDLRPAGEAAAAQTQ